MSRDIFVSVFINRDNFVSSNYFCLHRDCNESTGFSELLYMIEILQGLDQKPREFRRLRGCSSYWRKQPLPLGNQFWHMERSLGVLKIRRFVSRHFERVEAHGKKRSTRHPFGFPSKDKPCGTGIYIDKVELHAQNMIFLL